MRNSTLRLLLFISLFSPAALGLDAADYVFTGGKVYTVNEAEPWAEAIAVKGNEIVYVGNDAGAKKFVDADTVVVEANGKLILPGLIESHLHLLLGAASNAGLALSMEDQPDDVVRKLVDYAKANPQDEAIFGSGLNPALITSGKLDRSILDNAVSDRPVVILDVTFHNAWTNTKSLEVAGITKETANPENGTYVRDDGGKATGVILGGPAHIPVIKGANVITSDELGEAMPSMMELLTSNGFTSVIDMGFPFAAESGYQSLVDLDKADKLPVRVSLAYYFNSTELANEVLLNIKEYSERFKSEHVWLDTLKILGDGVIENRKAAMLAPYDDADSNGAMTVDGEFMYLKARDAVKMGFNVTTHCVGDRANRTVLDIYQRIRAAGYDETILTTTHASFVHPDDLPRWAKLNVIVQTTTIWLWNRPYYITAVGQKRHDSLQAPLRTWADDGVVIAFGSDYPATDGGAKGLNPFNNIYGAMRREVAPKLFEEVGALKGPLPPTNQVLTVEESIHAYTAGGAKMLGKFDELGTIEVGKKADIIMLSQNLLEAKVEEIPNTKVVMTMMDGRITHGADGIEADKNR